jgi:hypothetical protein
MGKSLVGVRDQQQGIKDSNALPFLPLMCEDLILKKSYSN